MMEIVGTLLFTSVHVILLVRELGRWEFVDMVFAFVPTTHNPKSTTIHSEQSKQKCLLCSGGGDGSGTKMQHLNALSKFINPNNGFTFNKIIIHIEKNNNRMQKKRKTKSAVHFLYLYIGKIAGVQYWKINGCVRRTTIFDCVLDVRRCFCMWTAATGNRLLVNNVNGDHIDGAVSIVQYRSSAHTCYYFYVFRNEWRSSIQRTGNTETGTRNYMAVIMVAL